MPSDGHPLGILLNCIFLFCMYYILVFFQSQLKKIRWKSTWTSPSLRQLDRVHLSQSASYLAVHLVMEKCLFMWKCSLSDHYHRRFHSLHNNREPLSPLFHLLILLVLVILGLTCGSCCPGSTTRPATN